MRTLPYPTFPVFALRSRQFGGGEIHGWNWLFDDGSRHGPLWQVAIRHTYTPHPVVVVTDGKCAGAPTIGAVIGPTGVADAARSALVQLLGNGSGRESRERAVHSALDQLTGPANGLEALGWSSQNVIVDGQATSFARWEFEDDWVVAADLGLSALAIQGRGADPRNFEVETVTREMWPRLIPAPG